MNIDTKRRILMLVLWTIMLVANIANAVSGNQPSWILVFCPLACLMFELLMGIFDEL